MHGIRVKKQHGQKNTHTAGINLGRSKVGRSKLPLGPLCKYLFKIREVSFRLHQVNSIKDNNPEHTIFHCPRWYEQRRAFYIE